VAVERGVIGRLAELLPAKRGKLFVVSDRGRVAASGRDPGARTAGEGHELIFCPGESGSAWRRSKRRPRKWCAAAATAPAWLIAFRRRHCHDMAASWRHLHARHPRDPGPTTLLAQVDAAIGGKTGSTWFPARNLVGSFHSAGGWP